MKTYLEIIRGLREDKDLNQSDIANIIGTTQQQYSKYETGESELPLRAFIALADYYGVSADHLLGRKDNWQNAPSLNRKIYSEHTLRSVIADILALSKMGRAAVIDYIALHKIKDAYMKLKNKNQSDPQP